MEKKTYVLKGYEDGYTHVILTEEEKNFISWFLAKNEIGWNYSLYDYDYFHNSIDEDDDIKLNRTIEYNKED